ncbi:MAG: DUF3179 domain-containing protein [Planctomycetaceae bacterium]|nr:DUF3179 domain-containing protein [Planctomycetaceae bacterium]MBT5123817.1 DUF3179 domain-containing protein [Planctomycetaceae bacterium]MBT6847023.1 DUF3179 domain-containing protein [Planctomycetaceae bacterium]MBT7916903.1 DUF3179 domain-containing protein [Planctomycetaceae bacterium]
MVTVKYVAAGVGILLLAVFLAYGTLLVSEYLALQVSNTGSDSEPLRVKITPGQFETPDRPFAAVQEISLDDQEEVITLNIGEQHYAFPKSWMNGMAEHVVSEIYKDLPITVTYCNESECVRVFQGQVGGEKMDIMQHGLADGHMAILVDGVPFLQEAEDIPYDEYPFELMTWGEWKTNHPDGLVLTEIIRNL